MTERWTWRGGAWVVAVAAVVGCAPAGPAVKAVDGAPCVWNVDCASGLCLPGEEDGAATGWQDGMCTSSCVDGCGEGSACVRLDAEALCLPACTEAAGCRDGYVCSPERGACLPDCRLGWSCGDALVCGDDGVCALPIDPGAAFGAPCEDELACASGICLAELDDDGASTGWVGGVCSEGCVAGACASGGVCVRLDDVLLCVPSCSGEGPACGEGLACNAVAGACLPDCRLGWACGDGFTCDAETGTCALGTVSGAGLGEPCEVDANCASGACAAAYDDGAFTGWSDGACVAPCGSASCGEASVCVVLDGVAWCVPGCDATAPCRDGYVCGDAVAGCLPDCRLGWACGEGLTCDAATGRCVPPLLAPVGEPCDGGGDCVTGICAAAWEDGAFTGWTDGMCIGACGSELCGAETTCAVLDGAAWCLPTCASPCRAGYVCDLDYGACLPDCRLGWACLTGYVCGANTGVCEAPTGGGLWDPCDSDDDCDSGLCVLQDDPGTAWSTSRCSISCGVSCPIGFACTPLGAESLCLPTCSGQQDCEASWVCDATVDVCLPSCQAGWVCPAGQTCNASGQCRSGGPGSGGG